MNALAVNARWLSDVDFDVAPELRVLWAELEILAGDVSISLLVEPESGNRRNYLIVSAYPLAEWFAFNWWFIATPHAGPVGGPDGVEALVRRKLNLRSAGSGFPWPDVSIQTDDEVFNVSATPSFDLSDRVQSVAAGDFILEKRASLDAIANFIERCVSRLEESGVRNTPLQEEWRRIGSLNASQEAFCRVSAAAGIDPFYLNEARQSALVGAFASGLHADLIAQVASAVKFSNLEGGLEWVQSAVRLLSKNASPPPDIDLAALRAVVGDQGRPGDMSRDKPWLVGWRQARLVRDALGISPTEKVDFQRILRTLATPASAPGLLVGLVEVDGGVPSVATPPIQKWSQRFVFGQALSYAVRESGGTPRAITAAEGYPQKVARAFAAEFLAPAEGLEKLLDGQVDEDARKKAGQFFGAPVQVVRHQIENQLLAS